MKKKLAIVTGSSSGFGLLTCLEFAKHGYDVLATMRNVEKGKVLIEQAQVKGLEDLIHISQLDVTCAESVQNFQKYVQQFERINVLVNNAGYAGAGFVEEIPIEEYREQFETNVFGVIQVTQAVLPIMRLQGFGNIINVSSISGRIGFPGLSPYIASKHALEGWSESLRLEMKPFGVNVSLVEPGSFQTNIWSTGKKVAEKSLQKTSPYFQTMKKIEDHLKQNEANYGNPLEVASTIVKVASLPSPDLRYPVGKGVKTGITLKNSLPWRIWESIFLQKLK
ncbi:oxidoreductase [Bacillus suaedaesalsae]|uniref:SDR family oxidoreductase n=1 Tax=Bacillus suaedaesalsae TaxID=2810349 RepID=A0ABS2DKD4_9BACI|nr:oxidoreductase [Bacillus suaedaesalsae]MBM6617981.1 SDR family oxidoreductase [Bacillus suaedaesalsae]